jgi:hypothetical protein
VDAAADFPAEIEGAPIVFCDVPKLVFDHDRPLRGSGVLCVNGDLDVRAGSNSFFNGLIYVTGSVTMAAPAEIKGAMVVRGTASMQGVGDFVTVAFDHAVLDRLQREIGSYRFSRPTRRAQLGNLVRFFIEEQTEDEEPGGSVVPFPGPIAGVPGGETAPKGSGGRDDDDDDRGRGNDRDRDDGSDRDRDNRGRGNDRDRDNDNKQSDAKKSDDQKSNANRIVDRLSQFLRRR